MQRKLACKELGLAVGLNPAQGFAHRAGDVGPGGAPRIVGDPPDALDFIQGECPAAVPEGRCLGDLSLRIHVILITLRRGGV